MRKNFTQQIISTFLLCAILTSFTQAQNIKNEKVDIKYFQPPLQPLPSEIKTFKRYIELNGLSMTDSRDQISKNLSNCLTLHGDRFQVVPSNADLELYAKLDQFIAEGSGISNEQRSETKSDKTVVKYTVYIGRANVVYPLYVRIKDIKKDTDIFQGFINKSDQYREIRTGELRDYKSAQEVLNKMIEDRRQYLRQEHFSELSSMMISTWSDYPAEMRWSINYVETSKKANYDDVVAARDATKTALASLSNTTPFLSEESKQLLASAIEKWTTILKESDPDNRKARIDKKVTQAIIENLAFCNFFLQNFTEAEKYMKDGKERNKQQWQYDLENSIEEMRKRFDANHLKYQ